MDRNQDARTPAAAAHPPAADVVGVDAAGATGIVRAAAVGDQPFAEPVLEWFGLVARELPWRRPEAGPWAVLVSEVMLQQTPVNRVLPAYEAWLARWPDPAALAAEPSGEAVRMWGRLGYPRRALRLHQAATAIVERHGGAVPDNLDDLLALPGIGTYTARAVTAFAFRQRQPVIDVNVRRLVARAIEGRAEGPVAVSRKDLDLVEDLLPADAETAARASAAFMELGALVCVARAPRCSGCPVRKRCAWLLAGSPPADGPARKPQGYAGTDRQVRGRLLAVLRDADGPVDATLLDAVWDEPVQRDRALRGLLDDGLAVALAPGVFALPGGTPAGSAR
ncbi:A/G-specific adenine glycosylase [Pseudofrankia sp. DC12]|uniref:A/G-specific adenine glycosylase n=1 Tax=Pseudofrankia sp. DC12 TaxID=683315 RepID=UPI0005F81DEF|nr:A/G-specific adenine glycosylase [Pseudofrankia sp. DC12]